MVFVFLSDSVEPRALIFMGEHQEENEKLFTKGYADDVWFHVNSTSSAHVYLRLPRGIEIGNIPEKLLEDCCQLVKKYSISGCKLESAKVIYTERANLKKCKGFRVGQIGFHNPNLVKYRIVQKRNTNEIVNRLEKTRIREPID